MPVERHADLPGARKYRRIRHGGFVIHRVGAGGCVTLHYVQLVAVIIAGPVKPRALIETRHIDHQRVAFPLAIRLPHPRISRCRTRVFQIDIAKCPVVLIGDRQSLVALKNLERIRHVSSARHARQIAANFRIQIHAVLVVLILLRFRGRQIRNFATVNNSRATRFRQQ